MGKEYKYLWVLDFNDLAVYNYKIDCSEHQTSSELIKILADVGHDTDHIEWMLSPYEEAINATSDLRGSDKIRPPIDNNNVTNKQ